MLADKAWLSVSSSAKRCWMGLKSRLCAGHLISSTTTWKPFLTWLCALVYCHFETRMDLPQTDANFHLIGTKGKRMHLAWAPLLSE